MAETGYSNRELDHIFEDIKGSLKRIEDQTTKHNGRMTKMEEWRNYIAGAISVILIVVVPILGWGLYILVTLDTRIHIGISQALSTYDIKVNENQ